MSPNFLTIMRSFNLLNYHMLTGYDIMCECLGEKTLTSFGFSFSLFHPFQLDLCLSPSNAECVWKAL